MWAHWSLQVMQTAGAAVVYCECRVRVMRDILTGATQTGGELIRERSWPRARQRGESVSQGGQIWENRGKQKGPLVKILHREE